MNMIQEAGEQLRKAAHEKIDCSKPVRVPDLAVGSCWAQGDVGILRIAVLPSGAQKIALPENGQIAPGNTQGSRHCIARGTPVTLYSVADNDQLSDLCIVADGVWTLEHPEHAHCTFDAGTYRVLHQQNEQRQRVLD